MCSKGAELYTAAGQGRKHQSNFLPFVAEVERIDGMEAVTEESQAVSPYLACAGGGLQIREEMQEEEEAAVF